MCSYLVKDGSAQDSIRKDTEKLRVVVSDEIGKLIQGNQNRLSLESISAITGTLLKENRLDEALVFLQCQSSRFISDYYFTSLLRRLVKLRYINPHFEAIESIFSPEFYRIKVKGRYLELFDCFQDYITYGIYDNVPPNPILDLDHFCNEYEEKVKLYEPAVVAYLRLESSGEVAPNEYFDIQYYCSRYTDVDIRKGVLLHYLNVGSQEGRKARKISLPRKSVAEYNELLSLEPALSTAWNCLDEIVSHVVVKPSHYVSHAICKRFRNLVRIVICISDESYLENFHSIDGLLDVVGIGYEPSEVLVVVTGSNISPSDIRHQIQVIYLDYEARFESFDEKVSTLHDLLGMLKPDKVCNVNSLVCWEVFNKFGKQLDTVASLYAYISELQYNSAGHRIGPVARYLPKVLSYISVVVENEAVIDEIFTQYCFPKLQRKQFIVERKTIAKFGCLHRTNSELLDHVNNSFGENKLNGDRDTNCFVTEQENGKNIPREINVSNKNDRIDVSCVINGHVEGHIIAATIKSVINACRIANENQITTEILVILDNPDNITREVVVDWFSRTVDAIEIVDYRDPGLSRNHGARVASGKYVSFIDGDDLWGESWLLESLNMAERSPKSVFHPEFNVVFGSKESHVFRHIDMMSTEFHTETLYRNNYWTALVFGERDVFMEHPYGITNLESGFAYEDWSWNVTVLKYGYAHRVVPDSCHFIRKDNRVYSQGNKTIGSGSIPRILPIYSDV